MEQLLKSGWSRQGWWQVGILGVNSDLHPWIRACQPGSSHGRCLEIFSRFGLLKFRQKIAYRKEYEGQSWWCFGARDFLWCRLDFPRWVWGQSQEEPISFYLLLVESWDKLRSSLWSTSGGIRPPWSAHKPWILNFLGLFSLNISLISAPWFPWLQRVCSRAALGGLMLDLRICTLSPTLLLTSQLFSLW